jgi:ferritin
MQALQHGAEGNMEWTTASELAEASIEAAYTATRCELAELVTSAMKMASSYQSKSFIEIFIATQIPQETLGTIIFTLCCDG